LTAANKRSEFQMRSRTSEWCTLIATVTLCFVLGYVAIGYARQTWFSARAEPVMVEADFSQHLKANQAPVLLYGTATCGYCQKARTYFQQHNIAFVDLRVDADPAANAAFKSLGRRSVPQIIIRNRLISGFNQSAIEDALRLLK
jgi:mycoredoxin